jgi:hypothetical protein
VRRPSNGLLAAVSTLAVAWVAPSASVSAVEPEIVDADDDRLAAERAVEHAREAAGRGAYDEALREFARALELRPSPKLHYNIAVCHQHLMIEADRAGDDSAALGHRRRAALAYARYLERSPEAADRADVEALIDRLGGAPANDPDGAAASSNEDAPTSFKGEWEALERGRREAAVAPAARERSRGDADIERPARHYRHADVGLAFAVLVIQPAQVASSQNVEGLPLLGAGLRAGAFLGPRRRVNLGAEAFAFGATERAPDKHALTAGHIGVTAGYGLPLGSSRRIELGFGGMVAAAGQTLRRRGVSEATCPTVSSDENEVSKRGALILAGRLTLAVLLGHRRRHALALRIAPGLGLFGEGSKDDREACQGEESPFQEFGLSAGPGLVVLSDLGYAARF